MQTRKGKSQIYSRSNSAKTESIRDFHAISRVHDRVLHSYIATGSTHMAPKPKRALPKAGDFGTSSYSSSEENTGTSSAVVVPKTSPYGEDNPAVAVVVPKTPPYGEDISAAAAIMPKTHPCGEDVPTSSAGLPKTPPYGEAAVSKSPLPVTPPKGHSWTGLGPSELAKSQGYQNTMDWGRLLAKAIPAKSMPKDRGFPLFSIGGSSGSGGASAPPEASSSSTEVHGVDMKHDTGKLEFWRTVFQGTSPPEEILAKASSAVIVPKAKPSAQAKAGSPDRHDPIPSAGSPEPSPSIGPDGPLTSVDSDLDSDSDVRREQLRQRNLGDFITTMLEDTRRARGSREIDPDSIYYQQDADQYDQPWHWQDTYGGDHEEEEDEEEEPMNDPEVEPGPISDLDNETKRNMRDVPTPPSPTISSLSSSSVRALLAEGDTQELRSPMSSETASEVLAILSDPANEEVGMELGHKIASGGMAMTHLHHRVQDKLRQLQELAEKEIMMMTAPGSADASGSRPTTSAEASGSRPSTSAEASGSRPRAEDDDEDESPVRPADRRNRRNRKPK